MAYVSSLSTVPTTTTSLSSRPHLFSKTSTHPFKVSCNASSDDNNPKLILPMQNVDRRNLLVGLGGLYGAANLTNIGPALAHPVIAPDDLSKCVAATDNVRDPENAVRGVACCPPTTGVKPVPYVLPEFPVLRYRPAIHRLTDDYIKKYQKAVAALKELPDDHPHSWKQQGKIHCAYCNGAYKRQYLELLTGEDGEKSETLQIHGSSLFFPFHRWYLYFLERIMGKWIDDPTFALPYWNWDNPMGMMLPSVLEAPVCDDQGRCNPRNNPLFDPYRNVAHLPPAIIDLQYSSRTGDTGAFCVDQISANLTTMHTQMITTPTGNTDAFFGTDPDSEKGPQAGSIESGCHTAVHIWTGNPRMTNNEDMGNFYSAGYDTAFYAHHANVDRMWKIRKDLNPANKDPTTRDWEESSYVFYDENEKLVRVTNKDCKDIHKLGYDYENSSIQWRLGRPIPRNKASNVAAKSVGVVKKVEETEFPVKLDQIVKVLVKRPAIKRSEDDKKKANEMLYVNGIKFNSEQFFKFDVLVNDVDDGVETTAISSEFAGTFAQVPHNHGHEMFMTSGAAFGITELLEDIEAEDDEYVLVTLVPRAGTESATISEIKIQLVPIG